ncbi:MAG: hypothetical protein WCJ87_01895 [Burkholderiales bacterium]
MPHRQNRSALNTLLRLLTAAVAASGIGSAQADDPNPYYIGASTSVGYDSNVFRLPKAVGDTTYSYGVLGGIDQTFGRQRIYASGTLQGTRFQDLKDLDHTGYSANVGIDWATIYNLSGKLSHTSSQSLYNYGGSNTIQTNAKNLERRNETVAQLSYGSASLLSLDTSYTHRNQNYSDPAYRFNALNQDAVSAGLTYRPRESLTLGTALRYTFGNYRRERDFDRKDVDLTANWAPTGRSVINARLSYGERTSRNGGSAFDFTGTTGQLKWTYQPTGKLSFVTLFNRDTGAESGFINGQQAGTFGDESRLTNALSLNTTYALSSKIRFDLNLYANRRSLVFGSLRGRDSVRSAMLIATYKPLRNLSLSCNAGRDSRSASGQVSFDYGNNSVSCSVQITLQ